MRGDRAKLLTALVASAMVVGNSWGQVILPTADGTIIDGGGRGPFDGIPDFADWSFNQSSSEGAITLAAAVEQRVVWEFNLATAPAPPVTTTFTFRLRGAARFPAEPAQVLILSYAADLVETMADFSANPHSLVAEKLVQPFSPLTTYVVDVSAEVNERLLAGVRRIGLRFLIDPDSKSGQAFFDVLDTDPTTKPFLSIVNSIPGDLDGDDDVDVDDTAKLVNCMTGPGISALAACRVCDADLDLDVDLADAEVIFDRFEDFFEP